MHINDILVGDIYHVSIGEILPCDGILIEGHKIISDESMLTGESNLKQKNLITEDCIDNVKYKNSNCFLRSGTKIIEGHGKIVVCALG